jgi:hypothetical protein
MPPGLEIVVAANAALTDPAVRDAVRELHEAGAPLLQMVEALGLDDEMTTRVRIIVAELPPQVIAGIRDATVAMLDAGGVSLPLDCAVTQAQLDDGVPVSVDVVAEAGVPTIRIRPAASN